MDAVLLDTNIVSYLFKGDTRADLYRKHIEGKTHAISFVTVGELYAWSGKKRWSPARIAKLESRMRSAIVVPYDAEICKAYGALWGLKGPDGSDRTISDNDRWIAACAIRHNIPLVTHNRKHFEGIPGLTVISETEPAASVVSPLLANLDTPPA